MPKIASEMSSQQREEDDVEETGPIRFSPEEEAELLRESNEQKAEANILFSNAKYEAAIQGYDQALSNCPHYRDYELAVLRNNISACHLKLHNWKEAIGAATRALEGLDRLDPPVKGDGSANSQVEEVDDETASRIELLRQSGRTREDVQKLRAKALLRRAKARVELGGWAALQGADEDYKRLSAMPNLSPLDRKSVENALRILPARLEESKTRETREMMQKLKQLGNSVLKPFGLSTDNFDFVKDEAAGGYSMQFNQSK